MGSEAQPLIKLRGKGAPILEIQGVDTTIVNLCVEEDDKMESEVPPQVKVRGRAGSTSIVEMKSFKGTNSKIANLFFENDEMESEVPPQIKVRRHSVGATPLKS